MFMRENRKKNGATQPGLDPAAASAAKKLSGNEPIPKLEDWRFNPDLSSPQAINKAHYMGGLSGSGPYTEAYASSIPFVGNDFEKKSGDPLKG